MKYDSDGPAHCIYFSTPVEDRDHLTRCRHPTCAKWRTDLLQMIRTKSDMLHTYPILLDILMTGLPVWLHRAAPPRPEEYPAAYQQFT
jgi:hypothetical protein